MSSTYSIFCVSHDPAIEATEDVPSREEAETWARDGFGAHPQCDLLIGRYSGAIVELGCPGAGLDSSRRHAGHGGWHRDTVWADAGLVRLAAAVASFERQGISTAPGRIPYAMTKLPMCWTGERLHRLRDVFGVSA